MEQLMGTESICPYCLKKIPAKYEEEKGEIYLSKECPEHGAIKTLFWRDGEMFKAWFEQSVHAPKQSRLKESDKGCPFDCGLCKEHEGGVCTAVLEITYRCNMDCKICFADTAKENYEPNLDEIRKLYETAKKYGGDCSIQLSGGEPTLRKDLPEIISIGKDMGFSHIQVNTNGLRLAAEPGYANILKDAGADLIYLQFDSCNDHVYERIRGRRLFQIKCKAIEYCKDASLGVLLVPTVVPGVNLNQLGDIVKFAKDNMPIVRGIHFQPVSYFGRFPDQIPKDESRCGLCDIIKGLEEQTDGEIHSRYISPRERYDPHCAFSGLFYLNEEGVLKGIPPKEANNVKDRAKDYAKLTNKFTNHHWRYIEKDSSKDVAKDVAKAQSAIGHFLKRLSAYTLSITGMGFQDVWNIDIGRLKGCCVHVITSDYEAVPLCAFHVTSLTGKRLYKNRIEENVILI